MNSTRSRILVPSLVIVGALVVAVALVALAPRSEAVVPERSLPVVRTEVVTTGAVDAIVRASGVTAPAREVTVLPEVSGRVVEVSPALIPGGRVRAGDILFRIDPRDYELAVEQLRGQVRSDELELELEIARQQTARAEWEILGDGREPSPLVLRESQRAAAEQSLASSRSALARAELDLERTVVRAPFNASVVEESVDVGQVVGVQTTTARLVGTDQLRVALSLRLEELSLIRLPSGDEDGSPVVVRQRLGGGRTVERAGRVVGLVDRLDPQTRRAEVLVVVEQPLDDAGGLPLLPGSNVEGLITGRVVEGAVRVPRTAVYDGSTVWVVTPDGTLARRTLDPVWGDEEALYVLEGIEAGEALVTSPLSAPIEGTRVDVLGGPR